MRSGNSSGLNFDVGIVDSKTTLLTQIRGVKLNSLLHLIIKKSKNKTRLNLREAI